MSQSQTKPHCNPTKDALPIYLLEKFEMELDKLIQDNQITKLEKFPNDLFVSPVVITVRKDKSVKNRIGLEKIK